MEVKFAKNRKGWHFFQLFSTTPVAKQKVVKRAKVLKNVGKKDLKNGVAKALECFISNFPPFFPGLTPF